MIIKIKNDYLRRTCLCVSIIPVALLLIMDAISVAVRISTREIRSGFISCWTGNFGWSIPRQPPAATNRGTGQGL